MSDQTLKKIVDGKIVPLSDKEAVSIQAEWKAEESRQKPVASRSIEERLADLEARVNALSTN